jgi:hypothetical protein
MRNYRRLLSGAALFGVLVVAAISLNDASEARLDRFVPRVCKDAFAFLRKRYVDDPALDPSSAEVELT